MSHQAQCIDRELIGHLMVRIWVDPELRANGMIMSGFVIELANTDLQVYCHEIFPRLSQARAVFDRVKADILLHWLGGTMPKLELYLDRFIQQLRGEGVI